MSEYTEKDCAHMARALQLAERGRYTAHPNPVVGCVLVKDDTVVGEGWHERTGEAHAEVNALEVAGDRARGSIVYVTLEPCAHHGRTPPCTVALIDAGVREVIAAMQDPNADVAGRGLRFLADAGIEVRTGLMQNAAADLNPGFLKRVAAKLPFVRLKLASSIDGCIAMTSGESQWITGPEARADVQRLRARSGAVMTGIGTVLADDPSLNVRAADIDTRGLQPIRVVLDSQLRMPLAAGMLALPGTTLVCCIGNPDTKPLQDANAEVMSFAAVDGHVDTHEVLLELAGRGVNEVLVEAGPGLAGHLLERDQVDELVIYQAPHIMGSQTMRLVETPSWSSLADRKELNITDVRRVGNDMRITATPKRQDEC
ncbi:MAG: bifunctional diaminohydroxyphosphoribosylaminopyrimidine deaminase/5-amino-6-(5-phosphoribosylamino)uracil reductase RibD [Proteobacteria bacterium]|nr:bifunctional diaminohydroxyphosphoribosylaminopyrimidine deaminase/5-amino-6-(5-phosphoribosylamino)uracil reductase RibD [Pseudomonadota bacterium]MCH9005226.1 bifunctional diaminohydroxyphosphoribosylaminopyrimidine deaminase/5-amino-6-(5-phosphoribosylamino)uracil reductase RibD [Pseudomonadota bacterium]